MLKHNFLQKMLQIPSDSASIVAPENLMDYCLPLLSRSSFLVGPSLSYQLMGSSEQWRYSVSAPRCQMLASLPPLHCTMRKAGWSWWTQGPSCPPVPNTMLTLSAGHTPGEVGPGEALLFYSTLKPRIKDDVTFHPGHIQDFLAHLRLPIIPFYSKCDFTSMILLLSPSFDFGGRYG